MLFGSLSFAIMGLAAHALADSCDWQVIAVARSFLALVLATVLALAAGARLVFWRPRTLWMRSIAGSISLVCTFFAFTRLPVSDVLTLTNMFPIWVALLSWPMLRESPSLGVWLCVASSAVGVALIQQPHFAEGNFASVMALIASFCAAIAMIGLHRLQAVDARAIVAHFSGVSLVFALTALACFEHPLQGRISFSREIWLLLLTVGTSATVGQLFLTKAFAAGSPAKVSVVALTQIVFVMLVEVIVWRRSFNPLTLTGMALVMVPTAWVLANSRQGDSECELVSASSLPEAGTGSTRFAEQPRP
jgi:drug/metabolite transporter (DMT)-like permease